MLVGLHVPTNFQMYRQTPKKYYWGGGGHSPLPPPPSGYASAFGCYFNTLWCYVQTLGCIFNTWMCSPLLTPTGVILTPQFLQYYYVCSFCATRFRTHIPFSKLYATNCDRLPRKLNWMLVLVYRLMISISIKIWKKMNDSSSIWTPPWWIWPRKGYILPLSLISLSL